MLAVCWSGSSEKEVRVMTDLSFEQVTTDLHWLAYVDHTLQGWPSFKAERAPSDIFCLEPGVVAFTKV